MSYSILELGQGCKINTKTLTNVTVGSGCSNAGKCWPCRVPCCRRRTNTLYRHVYVYYFLSFCDSIVYLCVWITTWKWNWSLHCVNTIVLLAIAIDPGVERNGETGTSCMLFSCYGRPTLHSSKIRSCIVTWINGSSGMLCAVILLFNLVILLHFHGVFLQLLRCKTLCSNLFENFRFFFFVLQVRYPASFIRVTWRRSFRCYIDFTAENAISGKCFCVWSMAALVGVDAREEINIFDTVEQIAWSMIHLVGQK